MPPHSLLQRVERLISDSLSDPATDIRKRWDSIAETVGAQCSRELGPIPIATLYDIDTATAVEYSGGDADATLQLYPILQQRITEMGLQQALDLDMAIVPMLCSMMETGMLVEREHLGTLNEIFDATLADLMKQCWRVAGEPFNITSPDDVARMLFDVLELPGGKRCKKKDRYSTGMEQLDRLTGLHPVVALLKEHREIAKLQSSYVVTLPLLLDENDVWHYELGLTTIPSGRLNGWGGVNPLGIPVRTELGREIRRAIRAREGKLLGAVDLSQIELRALAILSGDEHLLDAYYNNDDLHRNTAADAIYHCSRDTVTFEQRQRGKTTNFAVVNDISPLGLRDQFAVSGVMVEELECAEMLEAWHRRYSGVRPWWETIWAEGRQNGYIRSKLTGRILYCPGLRSPIDKVRAHAERVAINWPIQEFAMSLGKYGMAQTWDYLQSDCIADPLLYVHDELLVEVDDDAVGPVLVELMTGTPEALAQPIPIQAGWHSGLTWADLK